MSAEDQVEGFSVTPLTVFGIRWWGVIAITYGLLICIGGRIS